MTHFFAPGVVKAVLGPTNTGKTHYAIERMLARPSGVIGLPLRLLAREVYDKICAIKGAGQCALVTGEEKIIPKHARFYVCTVEAMPTMREFAFVAIDEVQLMQHPERGHVFTDRVLHMRGTDETLLLGAETARPLISQLLPDVFHETRERYSTLSYSGPIKITRLPKRSVIVAFSAPEVYAIAELIRRFRGGAAIVMGGLSPRTRNAQADMFQSGDVDFLVATDAIGMGLNLDTDHVAFASMRKFDGRRRRQLTAMEAGQIAGRAGRFRNNGTFGPTGDCPAFDDDLVSRIENHRYEPFRYAIWRNWDLKYDSIDSLLNSLNLAPPSKGSRRVVGAEDEAALERMISEVEVRDSLHSSHDVKQLWEVCQIPDFRNLTIDSHVRLLSEIYNVIKTNTGKIPNEFMNKQVSRLDHIDGDVDTLSSRLSQIRSWTYCANKTNWIRESEFWVEKTRSVEDRLSDALHEKLTARFVDRRTNTLLKRIGAGRIMDITIKDDGEVWAEDHKIGTLNGLSFTPDASGSELEAKTLSAAAQKAIGPEINRRLTSLCAGNHAIFTLNDKGQILWGGQTVGRISNGGTVFNPGAELIGGEYGNENLRNLAQDRMRDFLRAEVTTKLAPLQALKVLSENPQASSAARGFAYNMLETYGHIDRQRQRNLTRNIDQDARAELREVGVFFGQYDVYMYDLIKPKPATLLGVLSAFGAGGNKKPFIPFAGVTSIPNEGDLSSQNYSAESMARAGYKALGTRIIRFDILNRFAGLIRQAQRESGTRRFQIMQEMLALLGCTYADVQAVLKSLGYKSQIIENTEMVDETAPQELTAPVSPRFVETKKPAELAKTSNSDTLTPDISQDSPVEDAAPLEKSVLTEPVVSKPVVVESKPAEMPVVEKKARKKKDVNLNIFHHRIEGEDGTVSFETNTEYWFLPFKGKQNNGAQGGRQKQWGQNKKYRKPKKPKNQYKSGDRETRIEDSPFAALAALKNKDKK